MSGRVFFYGEARPGRKVRIGRAVVGLFVTGGQMYLTIDAPADLAVAEQNRGVEQRSARRAHNPEVAGSSPAPAIDHCPLPIANCQSAIDTGQAAGPGAGGRADAARTVPTTRADARVKDDAAAAPGSGLSRPAT